MSHPADCACRAWFKVDGLKHYDSAVEAIAEAKTMLYVSQADEARALETLAKGERVTLVYGFASVQITPPEDSDAAVAGLMGFLTLRRGDTDPEYFDGETGLQRWFRESHAESVSMVCHDRFGDL